MDSTKYQTKIANCSFKCSREHIRGFSCCSSSSPWLYVRGQSDIAPICHWCTGQLLKGIVCEASAAIDSNGIAGKRAVWGNGQQLLRSVEYITCREQGENRSLEKTWYAHTQRRKANGISFQQLSVVSDKKFNHIETHLKYSYHQRISFLWAVNYMIHIILYFYMFCK